MLQPRPHQTPIIEATLQAFYAGTKRAVVHLATGGGKTVIASLVAAELDRQCREQRGRPLRFLALAHRSELLDQMGDTLRRALPGSVVTVMQAERKVDQRADAVVASAQTAANRLDWLRSWSCGAFLDPSVSDVQRAAASPDLIIVDECHHYTLDNSTYSAALHAFPDALRLGISATLQRTDKRHLEDMFDSVVASAGITQGIREGWLCDLRGRLVRLSEIDLTNVRVSHGDFAQDELAAACDQDRINSRVVDVWLDHARDRLTLAFCCSVSHAHHMAEAFQAAGIAAVAVDADTDSTERRRVVAEFRAGRIRVLCNYGIYTEGFDCPRADCALMCRPTKSQLVYLQCVGRVTRIAPEKQNALVLDVVGLSERHRLMQLGVLFGGEGKLDLYGPDDDDEEDEEDDEIESVFAVITAPAEPRRTTGEFDMLKQQPPRAKLLWASFVTQAGAKRYVLDIGRYGRLIVEEHAIGDDVRYVIVRQHAKAASARGDVLHDGMLESDEAFGQAEDLARRCGIVTVSPWPLEDDGDGPSAAQLLDPNAAWRSRPATEGQEKVLRRKKMWRDGMTRGEASQLLTSAFAEQDSRPASSKQVWFLRSRGMNVSESISMREASRLIAKMVTS
jgi:superfamily II DNA or RNA helicase